MIRRQPRSTLFAYTTLFRSGGWRGEMRSSHILIIQRDLMGGVRCFVERVCLDAATGRLSGVGGGFIYQSHIKASAGAEGVISVGLDGMISPGVWTSPASAPICGTIINTLHSLH